VSKQWSFHWRFWRVQIGCRLLRHRSALASDRWVVQPTVIYDCAKP